MTGSPVSPGSGVEVEPAVRRRLHYGWVVVGASVLLLAGFLGTTLCFGLFVKPLEAQFGWSRAATSGVMSLCIGVQGAVGILMGRFTDKYNMGYVVAIGTVAGTAAYVLLSRVQSLWQFYLCFGLGAGICSGCAFSPVTATVSKWFDHRRRTLAVAIALTGIMVGQTVLSPVMNRVISGGHWRTGYLVSAVIVFACGLPGVFLLARKPTPLALHEGPAQAAPQSGAKTPVGPSGYSVREAAKTAPLWMIVITAFTMAFGFYTIMSQIVAYAKEVSIAAGQASLILTCVGLGSLVGGLLAGTFTTRWGGQRVLLVVFVAQAAAMFLFIATASAWSFLVAALFYGLVYGAGSPTRMALIPQLFGMRCIGSLMGCTTFAWSVGGIVGPYVAGYIHDSTKGYALAFVICGLLLLVGSASVFFWGSHKKVAEAVTETSKLGVVDE